MREIKITLDSIISLVDLANSYGFASRILFEELAELINKTLSNEEIESYSKEYLNDPEYTIDDYEGVKSELIYFKKIYC